MKKAISWVKNNLLFLSTIFLLAFIPLYPKLPLVDIKNTWVYVRIEDFIVLFVLAIWAFFLAKRKVTLKTPLTIPIMAFWIVGAIATIHGILIIFPTVANIFPNIAFLSYVRHIEYMSLFFVAYAAIRDKKMLTIIVAVLTVTLLGVVGYGFGQKYLGFYAFLTMNEEFAKGIPIQLSQLSRVPSTFAGHYDLAAYLVLIIPILASMIFGFKNWFIKIILAGSVLLGFVLMIMTVSRVSVFVLLVGLFFVLFFHKKRFVLFSIPFVLLLGFLFLSFQPTLLARFGNTVKEVNVIVDTNTGESIGHVTYTPAEYFKDKTIRRKRVDDKGSIDVAMTKYTDPEEATASAIYPFEYLPEQVPLVVATNVSTGENLPQGTGYINLSLSPVTTRLGMFVYEVEANENETSSKEAILFEGDFLVKRAAAYDLSFTTRFQGEWPRALEAFGKNIFFGSGYGSVSLAVDNNYFRMLGETGLLGIGSFFAIFLVLWIYIKHILPDIDSKPTRSFILGFAAGIIGLMLNATLIDVFEASKIAFLLWMLMGITFGFLTLYQKKKINLYESLKTVAGSPYLIVIYLLVLSIFVYTPMLTNYFTGDDFTWFRWAADCGNACSSAQSTLLSYFTDANGFFYRPGTKVYFYAMYHLFWLNQNVYHIVSLLLHFSVATVFFLLARRVLKSTFFAALSSVLFLLMSGYSEVVFWTAATGHLFNALFALTSLYFFVLWDERKKVYFYVLSLVSLILSLLFYEIAVVIPLLILAYKFVYDQTFSIKKIFKGYQYIGLAIPVVIYLLIRFSAQSHWFNGDYSYNILKLPFNIIGNIFGYISLTLFGPLSLRIYEQARNFSKENLLVSFIAVLMIGALLVYGYRKIIRYIKSEDRKLITFSFLFFVIALLPFIGLGNITSRYSYLASLGIILIFIFLIKKLYEFLLENGRDVAVTSITVILSVFALLHMIQVQQILDDWYTAGEKSRKFFISIDSLYSNSWGEGPVEIHFVNVPIKTGEAWIYPVGLSDAVWVAFRNDQLRIFTHPTVEQALGQVGFDLSKRVFEFQDDGSVKEVIRLKTPETQINE